MGKFVKRVLTCLALCGLLLLGACVPKADPVVAPPAATDTPTPTREAAVVAQQVETATPLAATIPPTPTPTPAVMTLGAVGDILITSSQVRDARIDKTDAYDFSPCFAAISPLLQSVDLMCGNLETVLGGADSGYSGTQYGDSNLPSFCVPDALAQNLANAGFDVLTTANNHCLDRGKDGLFRTIEVLQTTGLTQTGTFANEEARSTPCIVEVNGIRIGIVAATRLINDRVSRITTNDARVSIAQLYDNGESYALTEELKTDIANVKAAGADFVVGFIHWDYETNDPVATATKNYAIALLEAGVDCILGSHPHRVKSCEYVTVQRESGAYTGLVVYSMGNFIANEATEQAIGCFIQLTIEKPCGEPAVLVDAAYLPTVCYKQELDGMNRYEVAPVLSDLSLLHSRFLVLSDQCLKRFADGRAHVAKMLGGDGKLRLLSDGSAIASVSPTPASTD